MGAQDFVTIAQGDDVGEAFSAAVDEAAHEYGHGGYTGTIAEKDSYVRICELDGLDQGAAIDAAYKLMAYDDEPRVADKWGPAGASKLADGSWMFFGLAAS